MILPEPLPCFCGGEKSSATPAAPLRVDCFCVRTVLQGIGNMLSAWSCGRNDYIVSLSVGSARGAREAEPCWRPSAASCPVSGRRPLRPATRTLSWVHGLPRGELARSPLCPGPSVRGRQRLAGLGTCPVLQGNAVFLTARGVEVPAGLPEPDDARGGSALGCVPPRSSHGLPTPRLLRARLRFRAQLCGCLCPGQDALSPRPFFVVSVREQH